MRSASISYKRVVPWNDDTYPYREGFPAKDAKTPTRKEQLAAALDEADVSEYCGSRLHWFGETTSGMLILLFCRASNPFR